MTLREHLHAYKRRLIAQALRDAGGNVTDAARALGCCRELVYRYSSPTEIEEAREVAADLRSTA